MRAGTSCGQVITWFSTAGARTCCSLTSDRYYDGARRSDRRRSKRREGTPRFRNYIKWVAAQDERSRRFLLARTRSAGLHSRHAHRSLAKILRADARSRPRRQYRPVRQAGSVAPSHGPRRRRHTRYPPAGRLGADAEPTHRPAGRRLQCDGIRAAPTKCPAWRTSWARSSTTYP